MTDKHENKVRKNFMLTKECLDYLERLKNYAHPELSYSQIVDRAITGYAIFKKV